MHPTKKRILESAIQLFNEKGLAHVRLQHIADQTGISVGNLAYHYHSKKAIVEAIDEELSASIGPIISKRRSFPNLIDLDAQLSQYFNLLTKYSFYFLDLIEVQRIYPKLYKRRERYSNEIIDQIKGWFVSNIEKGLIRPEIRPGHYSIISYTIWMIITFWMSRPMRNNAHEDLERKFKEVVWSQVLPHLTDLGKIEFDLIIELSIGASEQDEGSNRT